MTLTELLQETRDLTDDTIGPKHKWSDQRLVNFLSEGQDRFCELTGFWTDKRSYSITTVVGQQSYPINAQIIEVRSVWDGTRKLVRFIENDKPQQSPQTFTTTNGPVSWQMDDETGYITFIEPITKIQTLTLRVHRRSLVPLNTKTGGVFTAQPEIPPTLHLALAEYAAYKAFGDHDRELQDPVKAKDHFANFTDYVSRGKVLFDRMNNASPQITPSQQYVV